MGWNKGKVGNDKDVCVFLASSYGMSYCNALDTNL